MKNSIYIVLAFYVLIAALSIVFFNGTGDAGDSVYHYLFAKYAPVHPELFFNHWAKPLFVLLASPFAQIGFVGLKIFNALIVGLTLWLTYRIALGLHLKNAALVSLFMIFTPLYYVLTFSGLTEPLFALMTAVGIYFVVKEKYMSSCLVISFLPYVRSEGLILIGVFAFYFLCKHQWKIIPFLMFGSLVYALAGYFMLGDLLWVFNKIPYAKLSSTYGSGQLFHFIDQLTYVLGIPLYILLGLGIVATLRELFNKQIKWEQHVLIFLGFAGFFVAHSLFWYLGIFNSMGLKRVFLGIMPMMAILALQGFNFLTEELLENKKVPRQLLQGVLLVYIVVFPFTSNPAAVNWERDMMLSKDQQLALQAAKFMTDNKGDQFSLMATHPYIWEALNKDCFDPNKRIHFGIGSIHEMKSGDLIFWDSWFAVVESQVTKEALDQHPDLINIYHAHEHEYGLDITHAIYEKK